MPDDENDDAPIRGHIRQSGYRRVAHGLFLVDRPQDDPDEELRRDLRAWLALLPTGAAFTHLTAAKVLGWHLPPSLPENLPVFAAVSQRDRRPRRPGLICSREKRPQEPGTVHGLPVEPAPQVLLRAARDLGVLDLVILVDSARRLGHVDDVAMHAILESRRPGVRRLRQAWGLSTGKAESAGESVLAVFDAAMDIPVEPQARLHDDNGHLVGVVDLRVIGTRLVHEYDGGVHRRRDQHRTDLRRDRALARASYQRRGFTLDDLTNHAGVVMHEVDRDLERPHVLARLRRWRALVADSFLSEAGRDRMMHRWQRQMGLVDWSNRPA